MSIFQSGSVYKTADSVIGTSGKPIRIYNIAWLSGTTAGYVNLYNGTGTSGNLYYKLDGTASKTKVENFTNGLWFPSGCFLDVDANVTSVVIDYGQEI